MMSEGTSVALKSAVHPVLRSFSLLGLGVALGFCADLRFAEAEPGSAEKTERGGKQGTGENTSPLLATGDGNVGMAGAVDPVAILRGVREAQASIKQTLQGRLRKGAVSVVYRMVLEGLQVRFEFPNAVPPAPALVTLRFGETSSTLEVGGAGAVGASKKVDFSDEIGGTGVFYEDLALRFLYWPDARLEGEESLMLSKCWKLRVRRPAGVRSPYSEVVVWVSQSSGAFLKSEAYGADGKLVKRLTVRSIQSIDRVTTLKQLRIESPLSGPTPAYLDVDGQPAPRTGK